MTDHDVNLLGSQANYDLNQDSTEPEANDSISRVVVKEDEEGPGLDAVKAEEDLEKDHFEDDLDVSSVDADDDTEGHDGGSQQSFEEDSIKYEENTEQDPAKSDLSAPGMASEAKSQLEALLEARRQLKQEIESTITRRKQMGGYLNFTDDEFMVMAIICSSKEYINIKDIREWDRQHFGPEEHSPCHLYESYDVPIVTRGKGAVPNEREYTIDPATARLCLRHVLETPRLGTFRFLDLPAEIRNRIYLMMLNFDDSQIKFAFESLDLDVNLACKACLTGQATTGIHASYCYRPSLLSIHCWKVGSPLQICRQMYSEALPIFYSMNTFWFDLIGFSQALARVLTKHSKHLTRIHVDMKLRGPEDSIKEALVLIGQHGDRLPALDELAFAVGDQDWLLGMGPYEEVSELATLFDIAARAKTVKFYGIKHHGCDRFESFFRKGMAELRQNTAGNVIDSKEREADES